MQFDFTKKQKKIISISCVAIFILFSILICWFIGRPMLKFVSQPDRFRAWVDGHGFYGRLAFVGMMVLQVFIAIIPGEPLEIGAGYAFGMWEGTLLCMLGALIGSALVFLFVRRFGMKAAEVFFSKEKIRSLRFLKNKKKLNLWVFIIFAIPGTPKDLLCYFVGLTEMKFSTWMLITAVARIPSIITSTIGGDALGMKNYLFAIIVFAVTMLISASGILIYNRICKKQEEKVHEHSGDDSI